MSKPKTQLTVAETYEIEELPRRGECDNCQDFGDLYALVQDSEPDAEWAYCLTCCRRQIRSRRHF